MKNLLLIGGAVVAIAAFSIIGCDKDDITTLQTTSNAGRSIADQVNALAKEPLSNDELISLRWMREEEKLAHDVYITLYNKWRVNIFKNIAESEQTHQDAVLTLLIKYGIPDPAASKAVGVFSNPTLQDLYNQLVTRGNTSLMEAFKVGATIEDLDIYDLEDWLTKVDNRDIVYVYQNLNKGSRNHLRSFYSQIVSAGGTYTAQYITQAQLEAIVNSPKETGAW